MPGNGRLARIRAALGGWQFVVVHNAWEVNCWLDNCWLVGKVELVKAQLHLADSCCHSQYLSRSLYTKAPQKRVVGVKHSIETPSCGLFYSPDQLTFASYSKLSLSLRSATSSDASSRWFFSAASWRLSSSTFLLESSSIFCSCCTCCSYLGPKLVGGILSAAIWRAWSGRFRREVC